jgi:hypothetical protein
MEPASGISLAILGLVLITLAAILFLMNVWFENERLQNGTYACWFIGITLVALGLLLQPQSDIGAVFIVIAFALLVTTGWEALENERRRTLLWLRSRLEEWSRDPSWGYRVKADAVPYENYENRRRRVRIFWLKNSEEMKNPLELKEEDGLTHHAIYRAIASYLPHTSNEEIQALVPKVHAFFTRHTDIFEHRGIKAWVVSGPRFEIYAV